MRPGRSRSSGSPAASWGPGPSTPTASPAWRALPSREVLLASWPAAMQSPTGDAGRLLAANIRNLGYALAQVRDQKTPQRELTPRTHPPEPRPVDRDKGDTMAVLTQDDLLEAIDKMTVLELSEFIKLLRGALRRHRRRPSRGCRGPGRRRRRRWCRPGRRRGADRVHRDPDRDRAQQDPGHQGCPRAHRPRPQGGQGPGRRVPEAGQGRRHQGRAEKIKAALEEQGAKVEIK